jgi:hypothetical protein
MDKKISKKCCILFQGLREVGMGSVEHRYFICGLDKMGKERELSGTIDIDSNRMLCAMPVCVLYFLQQVYPNLCIFILQEFI